MLFICKIYLILSRIMSIPNDSDLLMGLHSSPTGSVGSVTPHPSSPSERIIGMCNALISIARDEGRPPHDPLVVLTFKMKMECEMLDFERGTEPSTVRELSFKTAQSNTPVSNVSGSPATVSTFKRNTQGVLVETVKNVCTGCSDFRCVLDMDTLATIPDHMKWMEDHRMFKSRLCEKHPGAVHTGDTCQEWIKKGQQCRRVLSPHNPFFHSKSKILAKETLLVIERICRGSSMKTMKKDLRLGKNTLTEVIRKLSVSCLWETQSPFRFNRCAVDETYFGKRKYHKGKATRAKGAWFISVTEILPDKKSGKTIWTAVRKVDRDTALSFVLDHIVGSRSTVFTDSATIYGTLDEWCRHEQCNHSVAWATENGVHTNHAEGAHGVVKKFMRLITTTYGKGSHALEERVALATCMFGMPDPAARLQYMLQIAKRHWGDPGNHVSSQDGELDAAEKAKEGEEEEVIFDDDDEKEEERDDEEAPIVELVDEVECADDEADVDSLDGFGLEALHRTALREACMTGDVIPKEVMMKVFESHRVPVIFLPGPMPKGNARRKVNEAKEIAVLMQNGDHWFGMRMWKEYRLLEIYDSRRTFNAAARLEKINAAKVFTKELTGMWFKTRAKHAFINAKKGEEKDGGLHTVNMLLEVLGIPEVYNRSRMAGLVAEPAAEDEEAEGQA